MGFLLDTDVCIQVLRKKSSILSLWDDFDEIGLSFMTVAELYYGVFKSGRVEFHHRSTQKFCNMFTVFEANNEACVLFGRAKSSLQSKGMLIPDADLFIAATAIAYDKTLVSNNLQHFKRLEDFGLRLEPWK